MPYEQRAKDHFHRALQRSKTVLAIYDLLINSAPAALDATDILRSATVLGVSALDYLVHIVVRLEIEDRALRKRAIESVSIPIGLSYLESAEFVKAAGLHVKSVNGYKSFVSPAKLSEALKPILNRPWDDISCAFGDNSERIKRRLTLIVNLRNRIAHEGDLDAETLIPVSYDIERQDVHEMIIFLERLGNAIVEAAVSRQSELSMTNVQEPVSFPINLRPSVKGMPKNSLTVHRLPNGCWHARNHSKNDKWKDAERWVEVRRLARIRSLGCCKHCWSTETAARTAELQSLLGP